MTKELEDMQLAKRAAKFAALLGSCEVTGRNGSSLGTEAGIATALQILTRMRGKNGSVYVIGNGGSAAVASHAVIDLINVAKLRAFTLHEPSVLTCIVNDYGYENAYSRLLAHMARPEDILIAISSSGRSMNIRNAATQVINNGGSVITLSGFLHDNPLRSMGDVNIWLDISDYGLVEIGHQFILHNMSDRFGAGYGSTAA
ncbi:MAG: SIS domain-containing protein [Gallionella sp.]|nr:SIS domain-containing protein [Gallionella sp.]